MSNLALQRINKAVSATLHKVKVIPKTSSSNTVVNGKTVFNFIKNSSYDNKVNAFKSFKSINSVNKTTLNNFKHDVKQSINKQQSIPFFPNSFTAIKTVYETESKLVRDNAFMIVDLGAVERQYERWCTELPRVSPFYAVKCNSDISILSTLHTVGTGFDCASGAEIKSCLSLGAKSENIIFANPIKNIPDLQYARKVGVTKMTFDNEDELYKIKEHFPEAELVLRLLPDDSGSVMRFGSKFGAPAEHIESLLKTAMKLNLNVIGTSFHIGSGCYDPHKYEQAIALSKSVFNTAESLGMNKLTFLDLGGGFPGNPIPHERTGETPAFEEFSAVIRESLDKHFPVEESKHIRIIAEPGRYMVTASQTLCTMVQGKRQEPVNNEDGSKKFLYYINDGVYGSFNCIMFDHVKPSPVPAYRFLSESSDDITVSSGITGLVPNHVRGFHTFAKPALSSATFFGPTCDSIDKIAADYTIEELSVGDYLIFPSMGAYTSAAATTFNGMKLPTKRYVRSKQ